MMQKRIRRIGSTLAVCLAAACGGDVDTVAPVAVSQLVLQTDRLVIPDSVRMVIRDGGAWQDVWARAMEGGQAAPMDRPIDFDREMVLVAAAGRMNTGARIQIDSVGLRGDGFLAVVRTFAACEGFTTDVYPVVMVRVGRTDRPVRWEERFNPCR